MFLIGEKEGWMVKVYMFSVCVCVCVCVLPNLYEVTRSQLGNNG